MARVLFTLPPLVGHLNPALAVAQALQRQGHEVAWAVHGQRLGTRLPRRSRIYPLDAGDTVSGIEAPKVRGLESVRLFFEDYTLPMARQCLPLIEAAARDFCPDVMAVDHQMPAGALVARKLGLPWASLVTTSASILKLSPMLDAWVSEQYQALQHDYLPAALHAERPDFSPHSALVFSIEALMGQAQSRVEAPYVFVGPTRGEGRHQVDFPWDWLRAGTRKLLVSLGTVSRDRDTRFFEVMMQAVRDRDDIQLVMVAPPELAAIAPDNVLVRDFVPQLALLPRLDGVICHAGHNTVCEALLHGLPLIVAPIRDDQPVIARQVIDAGAGLFMRHGKVTPAMAAATIDQLLGTPSLAVAAARLGDALQQAPGAEGAATQLVALADTAMTLLEVAG